jgi:hypothetical protein
MHVVKLIIAGPWVGRPMGEAMKAVLLGFGAYFREKGLIPEIGTYRKHYIV